MQMMTTQTKDDTPLPEDMEVMMAEAEGIDDLMDEHGEVTIDPGTGEVVVPGGVLVAVEVIAFGDNLAEILSEEELEEIGADICEKVRADSETRKEWYETFKSGMKRLGIYRPEDDGETGVTKVTHPLLVEAATQFQARAMSELLPPGGPVKTQIVGQQTPDVQAQGSRVAEYMNYQLTIEDRGYYDERDQMLYLLPFTGSEFDKQYVDPTTNKVVSRWVRSDDFIVPYDTKSLATATRYTHVVRMSHNEYRRAVAAGFYTDELLEEEHASADAIDDADEAEMTEVLTDLDGQTKPGVRVQGDEMHAFYECHIDYDLPGYEDDIALPFIITVDSKTEQVIGIRRNWKEDDANKQRRIWFTHKKFLPGFGFYGFGLLHCIGNLGEAATEILQILLDAGAFATLQGGFKSKDCRIPGDVTLEPGVWMDTEMTADELNKSFFTPPFKEPSQTLNTLLGVLVDAGQKFAATTETMTGDAATTGPVGTMVAQIEQGSKVFSGIHKRLHKAFGDEFIHIAELNGESLPEMYPYVPADGQRNVLKQDFDGRVDVVPVSDPNIFSSAQRIAMAQTALQLANAMPDLADRREAAVGLLNAMRFPDAEKIFPKKAEATRIDPVSEHVAVLLGRPIKAYLEQNHMAHNQTHQGQMQQLPQQYQAVMLAHIMEHEAMSQYLFAQQQGIQLPPANWGADKNGQVFPTLPPEMENQIAMQAAQAMAKFMQQQQAHQQAQNKQAQPQAQENPQAEQQMKMAAFEQDQKMKDIAFQKEQERKNAALAADAEREDALSGLSPALVKQADEFVKQTGIQMSPRELAVLSKTLGKSFAETVAAISRMAMAGQGGSQFQQATDFHTQEPRFK